MNNILSFVDQKIRSKVEKVLSDFDCSLKNALVVTDRGKNMVAAFRNEKHINCVAHLINNIVEKGIEQVPDISLLVKRCTKLVKYFKKSGTNSQLTTTLKSYTKTRWNTVFYLLESVEVNWSDITSILLEKGELHRIDGINFALLTSLAKTLSPFEESSKKLEADKYATMHIVHMHVSLLQKRCQVVLTDHDCIKQLKQKLNALIKNVLLENLTKFHKIALYLFPPAKKLIQFTDAEKRCVFDDCVSEITNMKEDLVIQSEQLNEINVEVSELYADFISTSDLHTDASSIREEMENYNNAFIRFIEEFDVLQWWEQHKLQYPQLHKLSCKILGTPASSASSERSFSLARNLISEKRVKICANDDKINKIMFLNSNISNFALETDVDVN